MSLNDFAHSGIYTVQQVAARPGIGTGLAYGPVRVDEIPAKRLSRRWVVPRGLFHAWLNEMPKGD